MSRPLSKVAPGWWDYTTSDTEILADAAVPMSLLADHPNVHFNYYRHGIGKVATEMH